MEEIDWEQLAKVITRKYLTKYPWLDQEEILSIAYESIFLAYTKFDSEKNNDILGWIKWKGGKILLDKLRVLGIFSRDNSNSRENPVIVDSDLSECAPSCYTESRLYELLESAPVLTEKEKTILVMHFYGGFKFCEIADHFGKGKATIRAWVKYAYKKILKYWESEQIQEYIISEFVK